MSRGVPPPWWAEARRSTLRPTMPEDPDAAAARTVRCPHCHALPGAPCVVPDTALPLRLAAHHPSRHALAGVAPPRLDADAVLDRRAGGGAA